MSHKKQLSDIRRDVDKCLKKAFEAEAGLKAISQICGDGFAPCESLSTPEVRPHNISSLADLLASQAEQSQDLLSNIEHEIKKLEALENRSVEVHS